METSHATAKRLARYRIIDSWLIDSLQSITRVLTGQRTNVGSRFVTNLSSVINISWLSWLFVGLFFVGAVEMLCNLTKRPEAALRLNGIWALMNMAFQVRCLNCFLSDTTRTQRIGRPFILSVTTKIYKPPENP